MGVTQSPTLEPMTGEIERKCLVDDVPGPDRLGVGTSCASGT